MAGQQIHIAETIRAMKVALKRKAGETSDSDNSLPDAQTHAHTNRGNKLQRRARYARSGRLDDTGGLAHRRKISHAGYSRYIIASKPPLYDADGDAVSAFDSEDEAEGDYADPHQREAQPLTEDAFGEVRLEHLLRPLTAASELPDHPSLSLAFKSKALTQMTEDAMEMVRRERVALWQAKRLLGRFRGDADWVPCEVLETERDEVMLLPTTHSAAVDEVQSAAPSVAVEQGVPEIDVVSADGGVVAVVDGMDGVETVDMAAQQGLNGRDVQPERSENGEAKGTEEEPANENTATNEPSVDGETTTTTTDPPHPSIENTTEDTAEEAASTHTSNSDKDGKNNGNAPSHAMTTRARARSPIASPSPSPTPSDSASILATNPWFSIPPSALPDRDLGLTATEAEETRRLLLLYVQKQEHVVRSLSTLYNGLARADRIRHQVLAACRAEGHMREDAKGNWGTEMSDGEDWVDIEALGLTVRDLKVGRDGVLGLEKGKDEAEDVEEEGRRVGGRRKRVHRMG